MLLVFTFETDSERERFEYIYNKYKNLLLHKAYYILKDNRLAEDAASEAFLRIYRNMDKIGDPDSPLTASFVVTIVRNTALTILGKEKKHFTEQYDDSSADSFNLEEHVVAALSAAEVGGLLKGLNDSMRDVFLLKFAHGLSHRKIGEIMNMTENNVTVQLHRAKKKIIQFMRKEGLC